MVRYKSQEIVNYGGYEKDIRINDNDSKLKIDYCCPYKPYPEGKTERAIQGIG